MGDTFSLGGDPSSIRASASLWSSFGESAGGASSDIKGMDSSEFAGDEAETFRRKVNDDLPPHLDTTSEAWGIVSKALSRYAGKLEGFQSQLSSLKVQHDNQQSKVSTAQASLNGAKSSDRQESTRVSTATLALQPGQTLPASTYVSQTSGAQSSYNEASADLQGTIDAANTVRSNHTDAVRACCDEINRAKGMRFEEPPGFWGRLRNSVVGWIKDHADILKKISGVLKIISAIAGVLSFIPVLAPIMGPIALLTGGAALAIDVTLKLATGEGSWLSIGIDAATMLLPGVGKLVGKGLRSAAPNLVHVADARAFKAVTAVRNSKAGKAFTAFKNTKVGKIAISAPAKGLDKINSLTAKGMSKIPGMKGLASRATNKAMAADTKYVARRTKPVGADQQAKVRAYKDRLEAGGHTKARGTGTSKWADYERAKTSGNREYDINEIGKGTGKRYADDISETRGSIEEVKNGSRYGLYSNDSKLVGTDKWNAKRDFIKDQMSDYNHALDAGVKGTDKMVYTVPDQGMATYFLDCANEVGAGNKIVVVVSP